jgi:membrane protein
VSPALVPPRPSASVGSTAPRLTPGILWSLLGETLYEWYEDRAPRLGAALAYYTVFALAPGLIVIIAVTALVLGKVAAEGQIIAEVRNLVGVAGARAIQAALENAGSAGSSLHATGLGVITLVFGLWGVFGELQDALNTIWGVTSRPGRGLLGTIKARFWSFAVVVGVGFLLLVSLAASAWLAAFGTFFSGWFLLPTSVLQLANAVLSFVVIGLMFAAIYRLLPDVRLAWRNVWIGAAVTALLFTLGKSLIGLYLGRSAAASAYGAAGSFVVILLWIYYSAQVFFFGAEFTKVYSRHFGVIVLPDPTAVILTAEARAAQGMGRHGRSIMRSHRVVLERLHWAKVQWPDGSRRLD